MVMIFTFTLYLTSSLGEFEYIPEKTTIPDFLVSLGNGFLISYLLLITIMLVTILIAMMGNTYTKVKAQGK